MNVFAADVINRTTLELKLSVNTPDFPVGTWIISPDLSALTAVPQKYWKISGDLVLEMTSGEKAVVDAALAPPATDGTGLWIASAPANDADAITRLATALKALDGPIP